MVSNSEVDFSRRSAGDESQIIINPVPLGINVKTVEVADHLGFSESMNGPEAASCPLFIARRGDVISPLSAFQTMMKIQHMVIYPASPSPKR